MNKFELPTPNRTWKKDDAKAAYLDLSTTVIEWQQYGAKFMGFINSAAIFQITFNDNMDIVIETWYPGQEREMCHGVDNIESAKQLAEGFYHNWLKKDFRNLLNEMRE